MATEICDVNRSREIIDICLKKFIEKGLYETTSRDLSTALRMQPSGLYYHFKSKDEVVLACAEEAAIQLENALILPSLALMDHPEELPEQPPEASEKMQAMTRFFAQVCTANKYREQMQPILSRMREREYAYCEKFAEKLGCTAQELAPWFFAVVAASESYMIFGPEAFSATPLDLMKPAVQLIKEKYAAEVAAKEE